MTRSPEWCEMVPDGTDTDGTEWNNCTVHGKLVLGDAYVCEDYVPDAYVEGFGRGWFTLVDGDGFLWAYVSDSDRWGCVLDTTDEYDELSLATAAYSIFRGFDSWEQIVDRFGIDAGGGHDPIRERVVALVADLALTLSDPTQAWDIAVTDFSYEVERLVTPPDGGE